jgi:oxygen-independent coproporphyrinogen-3 oxidase
LGAFFLGLRSKKGIDIEDFLKKYRYDLLSQKGKVVSRLRKEGLLSLKDGRLQPTRAGLAVADSLALI